MLNSNDPAIWLKDLFINYGFSFKLASLLSTAGLVLIVFFLSWLSNIVAKAIILKIITKVVRKTTSTWDDIFLEKKVFTRLSHFAPVLVIWFMSAWALKAYPVWLIIVHKLTYIYMIVIGTMIVNSFIEAWHSIYLTLPISKHRNIKGYVQLLKIFVALIAILIIVSVVFKKEVSTLLAGLGAMAAVLILVFKDTLLGLVASIQLSADKMLKVGDWITIPAREVDGVVTDISLNTVKVQNFDKTIITVPTYSLVNESFQNWIGMEEAGVRRIKRAFSIDMKSIRFADKELRGKICKLHYMSEIAGKENMEDQLIINDNLTGKSQYFSSGQMTNLGFFRIYAEAYLKNHPVIDKSQAIILRHREPEGSGLPLQVIAYTNKTDLVTYENVQSEIFEHLLAMISEFGLKVFQLPTGDDLLSISNKID